MLRERRRPGHHPRWKTACLAMRGRAGISRTSGITMCDWLFGIRPDDLKLRSRPLSRARPHRDRRGDVPDLCRVAAARVFLPRRAGLVCAGSLARRGWGIIDSCGGPKSVYWFFKRAMAPVALLAADEGLNGLWLHAVNDTPTPSTANSASRFIGMGRARQPGRTTLTVPARVDVGSCRRALRRFPRSYVRVPFGPPGHDVVAATLRDQATGALRGGGLPLSWPVSLAPARSRVTARAEPSRMDTRCTGDRPICARGRTSMSRDYPDDNYLTWSRAGSVRVGLTTIREGASPTGTCRP